MRNKINCDTTMKNISIPKNLECVIARRLIKENSLEVNIKRKREDV